MLRTIFFILIMAFVLRAAVASPFGALLGYLWFALFRPQEWVWIDISQLRLSLVLGCILLLNCLNKKSWPNLSHPISLGMISFLLTGLIAQGNATNQSLGWYWVDNFSRLTLVSLFTITLVDSERRLYLAILTICSSLGYHTAKAGLASLISGGVRFSDGLAGAFVDNNGYALAGVMIIPFFLIVANNVPPEWHHRKTIKWGYRIAVPLTAFAVVSTFSRGGLLALLAVVFSYVMIQRKRFMMVAVMSVAVIILLPFLPVPEGYLERVSTITTYNEVGETSAMSRLHFWRVAWDMAHDNPLGVGMFNFGSTYDRYDFSDGLYGHNRAVHSSHLQTLTENGFLGFAIWLWLFISSFLTCFRVRRYARYKLAESQSAQFLESVATALIISMVGFLVGGTFISMALNDLTWITFALVAALDRLCQAALHARETSAPEPLSEGLRPA